MDALEDNYKKYAVVYIDILGVKNAIKSDKSGELIKNMKKIVRAAKEEVDRILPDQNDKKSELQIKFFSDNVIFAIDLDKPSNDQYLLMFASCFIYKVLRDCKWCCRGSVAYGDLFINDDFVIGPALVTAYLLESNVAIYPRIIFDTDALETFKERHSFSSQLYYSIDNDGLAYLNFLTFPIDIRPLIPVFMNTCIQERNKHISDKKIVQKMDWFINYFKTTLNNWEDNDGQVENGD